MTHVRVVVADDHPMMRYGVAAVLATAPEVDVVGAASDGWELLAIVERERPDVVVTDIAMPGLDGVAATQRLLRAQPDLAVLVLTMHDEDEAIVSAIRAGARGFVLKGADRAELVRAIMAVADGQAVYGSGVSGRLPALLAAADARQRSEPFPELTPRERQVLALLGAGQRNSAIARELKMTEKTVRNHVSSILGKLAVPDRTAAALKARDAGLA
jgi:DNA-binding NarL/FixJ family response regulator